MSEHEGERQLDVYRERELPDTCFSDGVLGGPVTEIGSFVELLQDFIGELVEPVPSASLVLPDRWLRVVFADAQELPKGGTEREDVLRFKLRRLVPFRVDELRVAGTVVPSLGGSESVLLGFGVDVVLSQLEEAFGAAGVSIGQITSSSLALNTLLEPGDERRQLLVVAGKDDYTLVLSVGSTPLLYRYKSVDGALPLEVIGGMVRREIALTRSFVEEREAGASSLDRALVVAPEATAEHWLGWVDSSLDESAALIGERHLLPVGVAADLSASRIPLHDCAPMVGAAIQEIS